jgi:predicted acylesterase/phospholipase RssA
VLDPWQVAVVADGDLRSGLRSLVSRTAGRALGVVMAGGGARAMTHIGVLHELESAGLQVDRVAGCSVGSIVAAAHARGWDAAAVEAGCYEEFVRRRPFSDYTVPLVAMAKGRRTEEALRRQLGLDTRIESLPRQFRCVSTDLLARTPYVHRSGLLWEATAASVRLPVLFPPMRVDGRLLVDGGVLDNLPVDAMRRDATIGTVIAVDVGSLTGPEAALDYGMSVSGWRALRATLAKEASPYPGVSAILLRTMLTGSARAREAVRTEGLADLLLDVPLPGVALLDFDQVRPVAKAGYEHALPRIREWAATQATP